MNKNIIIRDFISITALGGVVGPILKPISVTTDTIRKILSGSNAAKEVYAVHNTLLFKLTLDNYMIPDSELFDGIGTLPIDPQVPDTTPDVEYIRLKDRVSDKYYELMIADGQLVWSEVTT